MEFTGFSVSFRIHPIKRAFKTMGFNEFFMKTQKCKVREMATQD